MFIKELGTSVLYQHKQTDRFSIHIKEVIIEGHLYHYCYCYNVNVILESAPDILFNLSSYLHIMIN